MPGMRLSNQVCYPRLLQSGHSTRVSDKCSQQNQEDKCNGIGNGFHSGSSNGFHCALTKQTQGIFWHGSPLETTQWTADCLLWTGEGVNANAIWGKFCRQVHHFDQNVATFWRICQVCIRLSNLSNLIDFFETWPIFCWTLGNCWPTFAVLEDMTWHFQSV